MAKYSLAKELEKVDYPIGTLRVYGSASIHLLDPGFRKPRDLDVLNHDLPLMIEDKLTHRIGLGIDNGEKAFLKEFQSLYSWNTVFSNQYVTVDTVSLQDMVLVKFIACTYANKTPKFDQHKHIGDFYCLPVNWEDLESKLPLISHLSKQASFKEFRNSFETLYKWRGL